MGLWLISTRAFVGSTKLIISEGERRLHNSKERTRCTATLHVRFDNRDAYTMHGCLNYHPAGYGDVGKRFTLNTSLAITLALTRPRPSLASSAGKFEIQQHVGTASLEQFTSRLQLFDNSDSKIRKQYANINANCWRNTAQAQCTYT